jgi:hypothetical protein
MFSNVKELELVFPLPLKALGSDEVSLVSAFTFINPGPLIVTGTLLL